MGIIDMTGQRFGKLVVVGLAPERMYKQAAWLCQCDCGEQTTVPGQNLRVGRTQSCGCGRLGRTPPNKTHGRSGTPLYNVWSEMKRRCANPNDPSYYLYGARGITVCDKWLDFVGFLEDMGECPEGKSLDRIDNDGNYEPSNCKWSTRSEQMKNRRPWKQHSQRQGF